MAAIASPLFEPTSVTALVKVICWGSCAAAVLLLIALLSSVLLSSVVFYSHDRSIKLMVDWLDVRIMPDGSNLNFPDNPSEHQSTEGSI